MRIEVSNGEIVDKATILAIKLAHLEDHSRRANVERELAVLDQALSKMGVTSQSPGYRRLLEINQTLWDIEDAIRGKEARKEFDDEFIELARSVYVQNDARARAKREINLSTHSELIEEKEYTDYT
ncbi:MAG: hypothetical protein GF331_14920 [Chitinivibrionales bacterium]|nr:hypothetical protein [Chitinivibrionales bacterium]